MSDERKPSGVGMITDLQYVEKSTYDALKKERDDARSIYHELSRFNKILDEERDRLAAENKRMREALEFYANGEHMLHNDHDIEIIDYGPDGHGEDHIVGKTAREALAKHRARMEGK